MKFSTNYNRFNHISRKYDCDFPVLVRPNLAVDIRKSVETGLVSSVITEPTYGEAELSDSSLNGRLVDDPLDLLNHSIIESNKPIGGTDVVSDSSST